MVDLAPKGKLSHRFDTARPTKMAEIKAILAETDNVVKRTKIIQMLKPIPMFADLHATLLKHLVEHHLQINILNSGDIVQMKDILEDMDFVYVYRGKLRVRMEHLYG